MNTLWAIRLKSSRIVSQSTIANRVRKSRAAKFGENATIKMQMSVFFLLLTLLCVEWTKVRVEKDMYSLMKWVRRNVTFDFMPSNKNLQSSGQTAKRTFFLSVSMWLNWFLFYFAHTFNLKSRVSFERVILARQFRMKTQKKRLFGERRYFALIQFHYDIFDKELKKNWWILCLETRSSRWINLFLRSIYIFTVSFDFIRHHCVCSNIQLAHANESLRLTFGNNEM